MTIETEESIAVFETSSAPPQRVRFKLVTHHNITGERGEHLFDIPGRLSGGAQLWLAQYAPDEYGKSSVNAAAILGFFQRAMPRDEFARFMRVVDDPEMSVELAALAKVLDYVVEKITGRRPTQPGDSSQSPPLAGQNWTAPPSPPAATSQPFRPPGT